MRAPAAPWIGSRARPARRRFRTTGARWTKSPVFAPAAPQRARAERSQRVRTAAPVQVVCRGVQDRSRRCALDQGHRRADRAQLAGGHGSHSRRGRSRPQPRRGDRHADRVPARGPRARGRPMKRSRTARARGAATPAPTARGSAAHLDVRRTVRDVPRGHGRHVPARDHPGGRRLADRGADRPVAARAQGAPRRGRLDPARLGHSSIA